MRTREYSNISENVYNDGSEWKEVGGGRKLQLSSDSFGATSTVEKLVNAIHIVCNHVE